MAEVHISKDPPSQKTAIFSRPCILLNHGMFLPSNLTIFSSNQRGET